jgi:uncharacterized protein (DUF433 family)
MSRVMEHLWFASANCVRIFCRVLTSMLSTNGVIVRNPEILGGTPVFRGTRVPFQALLDYLEGGDTLDEFLDDFPTVTREAAVSALELAKSLVVSQLG